jgi:hypothetical protein
MSPLEAGAYVLLLLPGFIFVQTRDYHLLRENKGQLEKTLEIILFSAFIWLISATLPGEFFFFGCRKVTLSALSDAASTFDGNPMQSARIFLFGASAWFFLIVCFYSFLVANSWGMLRKLNRVDAYIKYFSARDWYPSVAFRFFQENLDRLIVVESNVVKYCGLLFSAPDNKEDKYIILKNIAVLPSPGVKDKKPEPLPLVDSILIRVDEIGEIQALTSQTVKSKPVLQPWFTKTLLSILRISKRGLKFIWRAIRGA